MNKNLKETKKIVGVCIGDWKEFKNVRKNAERIFRKIENNIDKIIEEVDKCRQLVRKVSIGTNQKN